MNKSHQPRKIDRRSFLASAAAGSAALTLPVNVNAANPKSPASETLVTQLFKSLNDKQRKEICFDFDHSLRLKVNNNWHITKPRLGNSFSPDQQALVKDIFMGLHSEDYAKTVYNQVVHDSGKAGFADCSIALFGKPGTGKFEFVLTGRHCTRRCDGDSVEGSAFGAYYHDEIDGEGLQLDYVIDGWLSSRGRSVMGGPSGSGKSFLALHAAYSIARGQSFFGYEVEQGGVIYQAGEGGLGMKKRQKAYRKHFEVPADEEIPLVVFPAKVDLFSREGDTDRLIDAIKAARLTMTVPLRVVFIDTLATATIGADENSGKDMGFVLANIARIEEECGVHVCLVHHMNADGKKLRGHTSIQANVDTVILVTNDETTKIKTAKLKKQKDDEDGLEIRFTLAQVVVGLNQKTGRDLTSCVVLTVNEKEKLKKEAEQFGFSVRPSEEKILIPLFKAIDKYGRFVTGDDPKDPVEAHGKHVVDFEYYLDVAVEMDPGDDDKEKARDRLRKFFSYNNRFLMKAGVIGFERPFVWWTGKPIRGFPHTFPEEMRFRRNPGEIPEISGRKPGESDSAGVAEYLATDEVLL